MLEASLVDTALEIKAHQSRVKVTVFYVWIHGSINSPNNDFSNYNFSQTVVHHVCVICDVVEEMLG